MSPQPPHKTPGMSRRALLKTSLVAGVTLSAWPLVFPPASWGAEAGQPKRGGILRVRDRHNAATRHKAERGFYAYNAIRYGGTNNRAVRLGADGRDRQIRRDGNARPRT